MSAIPAPDLSDAQRKVLRANVFISEIEDWLQRYREANEVAIEVGKEGPSIFTMQRSDQIVSPSGDIACMVGDAVHNLRAALDFVVAAIYRSAGGDPNLSTFPIDKVRASLVKKSKFMELQQLAPDVANVILDEVFDGDAPDSFVALNHVDRADKHQLLTVTVAVNAAKIMSSTDPNDPKGYPSDTLVTLGKIRIPPGSLAALHNERIKHAAMDVVFGEDEVLPHSPVIPTLYRFRDLVVKLINAVEIYGSNAPAGAQKR